MVTNLVIFPVILPLLTGLLSAIFRTPSTTRRLLISLSAIAQVVIAGSLLLQATAYRVLFLPMGGWEAPFGITVGIDALSGILVFVTTIIGLACLCYDFDHAISDEAPLHLPLIQFMIAGVCLSFSTGDIFNLFVAFEIMLISSYALLVLHIPADRIKHAYGYLILNIIGSTLFLCAGGLVYEMFGSLNFATLAAAAPHFIADPRLLIICLLFIFVYGLKAGFFPLFYWLPNSYPSLPSGLGALFAGLLTKVGIYAILRVLSIFAPGTLPGALNVLLVLAIPTMVVGIILAISQKSIKTILSFNLVSHIGFMMLGLGLFSPTSISGTVFYMAHHMIVIASLFLIGGIMIRITGTDDITKMGNLWAQRPLLGLLFLVQAFGLVGIPPLSGFWGKAPIILDGARQGEFWGVGALVFASAMTLSSMIIVWFRAFYQDNDTCKLATPKLTYNFIAVVILVATSLSFGFGANVVTHLSFLASDQLFDSQSYIKTITSFKNIKAVTYKKGGH